MGSDKAKLSDRRTGFPQVLQPIWSWTPRTAAGPWSISRVTCWASTSPGPAASKPGCCRANDPAAVAAIEGRQVLPASVRRRQLPHCPSLPPHVKGKRSNGQCETPNSSLSAARFRAAVLFSRVPVGVEPCPRRRLPFPVCRDCLHGLGGIRSGRQRTDAGHIRPSTSDSSSSSSSSCSPPSGCSSRRRRCRRGDFRAALKLQSEPGSRRRQD